MDIPRNASKEILVNSKGIKSHKTVENALKIVENLEHRAGKDAEGKTGDGVGILLQISHKFFQKVCKELGISLGAVSYTHLDVYKRQVNCSPMFPNTYMMSSTKRFYECKRCV